MPADKSLIIIWKGRQVQVTRTAARRNSLTVKIDGDRILVRTSLRYPTDAIYDFLNRKESWILKHLENPKIRVAFEWANGQDVYILGRRYTLRLMYAPRGKLELRDDDCIIYGPSEKSWQNAYRKHAEGILDVLLDEFRRQLRYDVGDYTLKYRFYSSRWGCCFWKRREILINYYCVAMPVEAIKYIFYHELAHLEVNNHQKEFYDHLSQLDPDYRIGMKISRSYIIQ